MNLKGFTSGTCGICNHLNQMTFTQGLLRKGLFVHRDSTGYVISHHESGTRILGNLQTESQIQKSVDYLLVQADWTLPRDLLIHNPNVHHISYKLRNILDQL